MPGGIHAAEVVVAVGGGDQSADLGVVAVKGGQALQAADDGRHGLGDHVDEQLAVDLTGLSGGVTFGIIFSVYGLGFWYGVKLIMDDKDSDECKVK